MPHLPKKKPRTGLVRGFYNKLLFCVDRAHLAILAHTLELDLAVDQSEQRIVLADTDVVARMDVRASLANENVASQNELTVCALGAEALGLGITTVLGRAAAFLVREELETHRKHHLTPPKLRYNQDSHPAGSKASASCRSEPPEPLLRFRMPREV